MADSSRDVERQAPQARAAELTRAFSDPDPATRHEAARTLVGLVAGGGFDDLLPGLGDGMAAGLAPDVREPERRSASATVLAACIARDSARRLVPTEQILTWADLLLGWIAEHPLTEAVAAVLRDVAGSPHLGPAEAEYLLDRLHTHLLDVAELGRSLDHPAAETCADLVVGVLARGDDTAAEYPQMVEAWVSRLAATTPVVRHVLHALFVRLSLADASLPGRADVVMAVVATLRAASEASE